MANQVILLERKTFKRLLTVLIVFFSVFCMYGREMLVLYKCSRLCRYYDLEPEAVCIVEVR